MGHWDQGTYDIFEWKIGYISWRLSQNGVDLSNYT